MPRQILVATALKNFLKRVDKLPEEQFNYAYLRAWSPTCGTTGCLMGRLPELYPESGFYAGRSNLEGYQNIYLPGGEKLHYLTAPRLKGLFGCSEEWLNYLFYAEKCPVEGGPKLSVAYPVCVSSLDEVKGAIRFAIKHYSQTREKFAPTFPTKL